MFLVGQHGAIDRQYYERLTTIIIITTGDTTMPGFAIESIFGPAAGVIGGVLEQKGAQQQYNWQRKLMQEQELAAQRMGQFNQQMALDMWEKTNYPAQVEQMRKAGLNVGLMYKGSGPGGSTAFTPGAMPSTGGAPRSNLGMGLQFALQAEMQRAQIDKLKAETKATEAQVPLTQAQTELAKITTGNLRIDGQIKTYQSQLAALAVQKEGATLGDQVNTIKTGLAKLTADMQIAANNSEISTATKDEAIAKLKAEAFTAGVESHLRQAQVIQTGAATDKIRADIRKIGAEIENIEVTQQQRWGELSYTDREVVVKETLAKLQGQLTEFNTSDARSAQQWIDAIMGGLEVTAAARGGMGKGYKK